MRTQWILFLTVGILVFFGGCKKEETASNTPAAAATPAALATPGAPATVTVAATPDFTMSAQEFSKAFMDGNQEALKAKYAGKTIELTGVVHGFSATRQGSYFDIVGERIATLHFYPEDMKAWQKVGGANTITARGLFMSDGVFGINHCVLVSVSGTPTPAMTSKELAEKFYPSIYSFNKQFQQTDASVLVNNCMRIDGKLVAKQVGNFDSKQLVLEGTDDKNLVPIAMRDAGPGAPDPRDAVQVGQHVTVFGTWTLPDAGDLAKKAAMLHDAVIIPE